MTIVLSTACEHHQEIKVIRSLNEMPSIRLKRDSSNSNHINDDNLKKMFVTAASKEEIPINILKKTHKSTANLDENFVSNFYYSVNFISETTKPSPVQVNQLSTLALRVARLIKKRDQNDSVDYYQAPNDFCPFTNSPYCDETSEYRSEDGSCNNLQFTWWGMADTPFKRLLQPKYNDGLNEPRKMSVIKGKKLSNPRKIALKLKEATENEKNDVFTSLLPHFSQFIDHDITLTALVTKNDGSSIKCKCDSKNDNCINIPTPKEDLASRDQKCMALPRSSASFKYFDCDLGAREQLNTRTHWLDLSQLYGVDLETSLSLRAFKNGKLRSSLHQSKQKLF